MKVGSEAVKDVVRTANAFMLSCAKEPLALTSEEQERLFLELHGALYFLQEIVERGEK